MCGIAAIQAVNCESGITSSSLCVQSCPFLPGFYPAYCQCEWWCEWSSWPLQTLVVACHVCQVWEHSEGTLCWSMSFSSWWWLCTYMSEGVREDTNVTWPDFDESKKKQVRNKPETHNLKSFSASELKWFCQWVQWQFYTSVTYFELKSMWQFIWQFINNCIQLFCLW